jgi:hypothetical protein
METYQTKQRIINRTLTVEELPEEFEGLEVEVKVAVLPKDPSLEPGNKKQNKQTVPQGAKQVAQNTVQSKEDRLITIKQFAGIYKSGEYVMPEDEWYKQ